MFVSTKYRHLLEEEMLPWLRDLTGIALTDNIDMTCSKYEYTGLSILNGFGSGCVLLSSEILNRSSPLS